MLASSWVLTSHAIKILQHASDMHVLRVLGVPKRILMAKDVCIRQLLTGQGH